MRICFWYVFGTVLLYTWHALMLVYLKTSDYPDPSEGFWREFFLLSPDKHQLQLILDKLSPDDLLAQQVRNPSAAAAMSIC